MKLLANILAYVSLVFGLLCGLTAATQPDAAQEHDLATVGVVCVLGAIFWVLVTIRIELASK